MPLLQKSHRYSRWLSVLSLFGLLFSCSNNQQKSCKTDADCQGVSRLEGVCLKEICVFSNACERTCKDDKGCSTCGKDGDGFGFRCRNGTCLPVSQSGAIVSKHEQCGPAIGKNCQSGLTCNKPNEKSTFGFCYPQCDSTKSTCDNGKGKCIAHLKGDICLPNGTAEKNTACGLSASDKRVDLSKICKPSLSCVHLSSTNPQGFCFPTCNPQSTSCDNNKGQCIKLNDKTGACVPQPQGKEGDTCTTLDKLTSFAPKQLCQSKFACSQGKCIKRQLKGTFEKCGELTTCGSKALCVVLKRGATTGYCLPLCTTAGELCENKTGSCRRLKNGSGVCIPGTATENASCGVADVEKLDPSTFCKASLRCTKGKCVKLPEFGIDEICSADRLCKAPFKCIAFKAPGTIGVCLPSVEKCSATACADGRICLPGKTGNICARSCKSFKDCPKTQDCTKTKVAKTEVQYCSP